MTAIPHPATPSHMSVRRGWLRSHPVVTYFALAYVISWVIEIPLAAAAQGWTDWSPPRWIHYLAGYGPLAAAFVSTWLADGRAGVNDLVRRMVRWRVRPIWWLAALSPIVLYACTALILKLTRGTWTDVSLLGKVNFLPDLGVGAFILWFFTYGLGEETGWRGFALPQLQQKRSALSATLILAALWIGWHLPTFLYLPTYMQLGLSVLPMFALGIAAGAIGFTWLYNGSKGSILIAVSGHAALNFVTGSPAGDPIIAAVVSTAIIVWAVVVVLVWKPATLSPSGKQVPVPSSDL